MHKMNAPTVVVGGSICTGGARWGGSNRSGLQGATERGRHRTRGAWASTFAAAWVLAISPRVLLAEGNRVALCWGRPSALECTSSKTEEGATQYCRTQCVFWAKDAEKNQCREVWRCESPGWAAVAKESNRIVQSSCGKESAQAAKASLVAACPTCGVESFHIDGAAPAPIAEDLPDAVIAALLQRVQPKSKKKCATYVTNALLAAGVKVTKMPSAYQLGFSLEQAGFSALPEGSYRASAFRKGDVVVFQPVTGHPDGHVAAFDGQSWMSDFTQRELAVAPAYRTGTYRVYRLQP